MAPRIGEIFAIALGALVVVGCSDDESGTRNKPATGGGGKAGTGGTSGSGGATGGSGGTTPSGGSAGTSGSGGTAGGGGSAGSSGAPATGTGTMVPLYTYPTDATWQAVIDAKKAHPTVPILAVVNPNSGPGTNKDANYESGTQSLKDAGVVVIGYVATGYTANDPNTVVKPDIDKYVSWYSAVTGIFFDEQSNEAGKEVYYADLDAYTKSKGLTFTIGNPGTDTAETYVGKLDMMLIYESKGLPAVSSLGGWHASYDRANFGVIPYGVSSLDTAFVGSAKQYVGWIYLTDDDLPNPWDSLPPYFDALVAELAK